MAAALHSVRIADERFWRKVEKTHGCWLWTGARLTKGYGLVRRDTVGILAHRYSWILAHGAIPENMDVCHHCDNPQCVRPDHLFVGTRKANMEDKLTEQRVREIRRSEEHTSELQSQSN